MDLYGGTRHSSARATGSPDEARMITGHKTSKAFERYFQPHTQEKKDIYRRMRGGKKVAKENKGGKKGKVENR